MKLAIDYLKMLNLQDNSERTQYERAFYQAFRESNSQALMQHMWHIDKNEQRMRYKVADENIDIYWLMNGDEADGALAMNTSGTLSQIQCLRFDDPIANQPDRRAVEVLSVFANKGWMRPHRWHDICLGYKAHDITDIFATSNEALIELYKWLGFSIIDQQHYDDFNDMRYLIHCDLTARSESA